MDEFVLSVTELNAYVADRLTQDPFLKEIWVQGEICDLSVKHGTAYFVLSDAEASVDCMVFDYEESECAKSIQEGQTVLISGDVSIYRKNGRFRVIVRQARLVGLGELYAKMNQLRERLEKQGVFDAEHKRPLPAYPKKIGIVTSRQGAAIQDIINIAGRRNPFVSLLLYPVKVQGADAPGDIVQAIRYLNEHSDADVLIVGRGGGSAEDLFAFNDERVVMAVYGSRIPVISAVGHESDYTLCDLAADLRAPTPSAAAELAIPVKEDILSDIGNLRAAMKGGIRQLVSLRVSALERERQRLRASNPKIRLRAAEEWIDAYRQQSALKINLLYKNSALRYNTYKTALDALDPRRIFERGYALVLMEGRRIKSAARLAEGDNVTLAFADGSVRAKITAGWKEEQRS